MVVLLFVGGCDDAMEVSPDGFGLDALVADQAMILRTDDMRIRPRLDARAVDMMADAATPDAARVQDAHVLDATPIDMSRPDAGPPDPGACLNTVTVGAFEIFAYEASRTDATADNAGASAMGVCSRAGVLPWTNVTLEDARVACASVGFSVCASAHWQQACAGPDSWPYPYGRAYAAGTCNDHVVGSGALEVCGNRAACASPSGIYDQNGNVWEWTDDGQRRGASFKLLASMFRPEAGSCEVGFVVPEGFFGRDLGFRCCR